MKKFYTAIYCNEDGAGEVLEHKIRPGTAPGLFFLP